MRRFARALAERDVKGVEKVARLIGLDAVDAPPFEAFAQQYEAELTPETRAALLPGLESKSDAEKAAVIRQAAQEAYLEDLRHQLR